ncbi:hypothetical protein ACVIST_000347 [Bradyrhizobium elkanii]
MLRRLHDADAAVLHQAHRPGQEVRHRDKIRIEDRDELRPLSQPGNVLERMIDVAGLGVAVVRAGQIVAAELLGEPAQPEPAAVVEHPDAIIGIIEPGRADDGALQDRLLLIVGADEDVHERGIRAGSGSTQDRIDLG